MKTAIRLSLPKKAKPIKLLPKWAPSNKEGAEQQAGALHVDHKKKIYELHVTDGNRSAIIKLDHTELPDQSDEPQVLVSGQVSGPAIALMQKGATLESASKTEVVIYDETNDAEVNYRRDQQLVDEVQDVSHLIPDVGAADHIAEIVVDAKRLKEMAEAFGSDKLIITAVRGVKELENTTGPILHVRPLNGDHVAAFKQAERPRAKTEDVEPEATEPLIED
jgi:hypothetical protein